MKHTTTNRPRSTTISSSPNTPRARFLQKVQHAAIDARMKGYLGPEYDASGLEKARELVKKTMNTFPERQASFEGLYHTLDVINDAEAEKTFKTATYYKTHRQGRVRRVLFRQDPPALAQQPLGRQGQGRAGSARQDAAHAVEAQQDHHPAGLHRSVRRGGMGGMGGMGMGGMGMGGMGMGGMGMGGMGMERGSECQESSSGKCRRLRICLLPTAEGGSVRCDYRSPNAGRSDSTRAPGFGAACMARGLALSRRCSFAWRV